MPDLLTAVVFLPAVGAFLLILFPAEDHKNLKAGAIGISTLTFFVSLALWTGYDTSIGGYQYGADHAWIEALGVRYHLGIDGISLVLLVLTTFLTPLTLLGAWTAVSKHVREFVISILLLETGMLGAFVALDLFLFYLFWEVMLVPMYFLIGIWGGQRRIYAAVKFFIFTMTGSLLMLVAIIYVAAQADGSWNFALAAALQRTWEADVEGWLFAAFAIAFAIKVPLFPVHTWLPDAHTEAPTAGSVILAGVLLKLGVYGMIRFAFPMFPGAAMASAPYIAALSVAGIVYGALAAWVQPDMKKLVAYSSVSHLGFCTLGLSAMTTEGVTGSVYQMLAHGISTGGLFMLVGVLYERRHTRMLADYGGIARKVPVFAFFLVLITMASAGMPALSGFPGEFLILLGTFTAGFPLDTPLSFAPFGLELRAHHGFAILGASGVILAAVYLLFMVQKVLFGPLQHRANEKLSDMNLREIATLLPLAVLAVVMGVMPGIFLERIEPTATRFVQDMHAKTNIAYRPDPGARRVSAMVLPILKPSQRDRRRPALRQVNRALDHRVAKPVRKLLPHDARPIDPKGGGMPRLVPARRPQGGAR